MNHVQKKLMCLGAGPNQVPLIQKAVDLGAYVVTVDYLPDNVGHNYSHQSVDCSTTNKGAVLEVAQELQIDGIVTCASDVATPTVGFVAQRLGLPGGFAVAAETMSNKAKFRAFQREHNLNCPGFAIGQRFQDVAGHLAALSPPLMFKPVDTSGSRGVSRIGERDEGQWAEAFVYAQRYSRSKTVCVEEYVEGVDVSGDGLLVNGKLYALITHKHKREFVPIGHSLPTNILEKDQVRVLDEVTKNCLAVGYTDGPLDFDVRVSPSKVTVLEMSPRLGGNGIPMIIERGTGFDLIAATIRLALQDRVDLPESLNVVRRCGSWMFGSDRSGRLEEIATEKEIMARVPQVFQYRVHYSVGDQVPEFIHSANGLGYVLFDFPAPLSYDEVMHAIQSELRLRVSKAE